MKPIMHRIAIPIPSIMVINKSLVKKSTIDFQIPLKKSVIEFQISEKKSVIKLSYNTPVIYYY